MNGQRTKRSRTEDDKPTTSGLRPMHISLRSGERLFLNGAVLRVDRKVTLELLNDATFLLENHVLQVEDTTTPLRQLYFAAQAILMDPQNGKASQALFDAMAADLRACLATPSLLSGLDDVCALMASDRPFQALKALRALFEEEAAVLAGDAKPANTAASNRHSLPPVVTNRPAGVAKRPARLPEQRDLHGTDGGPAASEGIGPVPPQPFGNRDGRSAPPARPSTLLQ